VKSAAPIQHYLDLGATAHIDLLHANSRSGIHLIEDDSFNGFTPVGTFPKALALSIAERYEHSLTPAYVGQQAFKPYDRRCIDNVTFIGAAYVDLDTYNTEYAGCSFSDVWRAIQAQFPDLPMPTIAGSSGRGLQLVWCFQTGKPKSFAPDWQVMADTLVTSLKPYGADPRARDLARVLRISHSYNTKSGTRADLKQTGKPVTYETLQRWCNAYRKAQQASAPDTRRTRPGHAPDTTEQRPVRNNVIRHTTKNAYTLHAARMDDYRALAGLRGGRYTDGRRTAIYLFACSAAWYCHDSDTLTNEVQVFTERYIDQPERYTRLHIQQIIARQGEAKQGKKRQFKGKDDDPRYKFTNRKIIDQLGITHTEQRHLLTILGQGEKRERGRLRKAAQRRKAGTPTRDVYLDKVALQAQERRQMALGLAEKGLSSRQIAKELGVSKGSVFNYLKGCPTVNPFVCT
jgi:transposase